MSDGISSGTPTGQVAVLPAENTFFQFELQQIATYISQHTKYFEHAGEERNLLSQRFG